MKFWTRKPNSMTIMVTWHKLQISQIQHGKRPPYYCKSQFKNSLYLNEKSSDFDDIWYTNADLEFSDTQIARERLVNVKVTFAVELNRRYSVTLVQHYFAHWFYVGSGRHRCAWIGMQDPINSATHETRWFPAFPGHVLHRAVNNHDVIKMSDGHRNVVIR